MIPNDKYTWEGQIFILSIVTYSLHSKSTIKLIFKQIWEFSEILGYFQKVLAIFYARATRYGLFGKKFEFYNWFWTILTYQIDPQEKWDFKMPS
jgi:hypothetical protein